MGSRARIVLLESGAWLTAEELTQQNGLRHPDTKSLQLNTWKSEGLLFSVHFEETEYFPRYALDPAANYQPYPALADILQVFAGHKRSWGMAFWFFSVNSFLGGRRPQDVLALEAARVIAAAKDEVPPIVHG